MSIDSALFLPIFGGLLLLVAIIGGGFEYKDLKIPTVILFPRILAGIIGLFCLAFYIVDTRTGILPSK